MSRLLNETFRATALLVMLLMAGAINAEPVHPYADPLPFGDHVDDVDAMLERAFNRAKWTLVKESDADYSGELSHRGFDIRVQIAVREKALILTLDSVTLSSCTSQCRDLGEKPVLAWLLSLRRNLSYVLTSLVRDSLQREAEI
jgi:hypothetical protein